MGELVSKLGDRVLPEVVPILEQKLVSGSGETRQGVCLGLCEVINAASKAQLETFAEGMLPTVRDALCDTNDLVRVAAADAFAALHRALGQSLLDNVLPVLLAVVEGKDELGNGSPESALDALRAIVTSRGAPVAYALFSKLVGPEKKPKGNLGAKGSTSNVTGTLLSGAKARALAAIATAAPLDALVTHIPQILPPLLMLAAIQDKDAAGAVNDIITVVGEAKDIRDDSTDVAADAMQATVNELTSILNVICQLERWVAFFFKKK